MNGYPSKRQADYDAFVAGLTAISRAFGVAVASTEGVRLACRRGEFAGVTYIAHLPSGHLEPNFPGDDLDPACGKPANRTRQAEYDAFVAGLTALTRRYGVVLFATGGVFQGAWPSEFATLTYVADIVGDRLDPCFPNDGKGGIEIDGPSGAVLRMGDRVVYRLPDGSRNVGLVQGWRQGRVVIRRKAGHTEDVPEADCERRN
jgi:hypothetical protein